MSSLRAITVQPPWTVPILTGAKTVENRRQATCWRGQLAIHVSRTWSPHAATDPRIRGLDAVPDHLWRLATTSGAIIAVARLVDCHRDTGCCRHVWGNPDAWHLVLANITPLTVPVPARGNLGVWPVRDQLTIAVYTAFAAAGSAT